MKICTKCNTSQPLKNFYKETRGSGGKKARCKGCEVTYQRQWASENKDKIAIIAKRSKDYKKHGKGSIYIKKAYRQLPEPIPFGVTFKGIVKPKSINNIDDLLLLRNWWWMTTGSCPWKVIDAIEKVSKMDCV